MDLTPTKPRSDKDDMSDFTPIKVSDSSRPSTSGVRHIDVSYERVSQIMKEINETSDVEAARARQEIDFKRQKKVRATNH